MKRQPTLVEVFPGVHKPARDCTDAEMWAEAAARGTDTIMRCREALRMLDAGGNDPRFVAWRIRVRHDADIARLILLYIDARRAAEGEPPMGD